MILSSGPSAVEIVPGTTNVAPDMCKYNRFQCLHDVYVHTVHVVYCSRNLLLRYSAVNSNLYSCDIQ
jgi:hypothetical protein